MTHASFRKKTHLKNKHANVLSDALKALQDILDGAKSSPDGSDTGPSRNPTPTDVSDCSGAPSARSVPVLRSRR